MIKVGDIVSVTAKNPSGSSQITFGNIGVVTEIEDGDYKVHTESTDYWYGKDQIRLATKSEIKVAFIRAIS